MPLVAAWFFYYAGWADKLDHAGLGANPRSLGVAAQVIPWNFPLLMLAWKIAPALAAGNTVVLKPAETTPLSALIFAEILQQADLPPGVVNIITGAGDTGAALVAHDDVDKVAFTGSTAVGRAIAKQIAGTDKKVTLELGGKAANIVFDDAPIDQAIEGIVNGIFFNQGHVCCAGSRLLVQENVHDEVVERLKLRLSTLRLGDPLDKNTDIGAINSKEQLERIRELSRHRRGRGRRALERAVRDPRERVLVRADDLHQRADVEPHRPRGDLRPGALGAHLPHARRGDREGEQHPVRPVGRHLDRQGQPHPRRRRPAARRRDLGEHLQPVRPRRARSAATRSRATAARAAVTASPPTSRPPRSASRPSRPATGRPSSRRMPRPHRSRAAPSAPPPNGQDRDEGIEAMSRLAVPKTYKLYIGGAFPRSESGRTYEVLQADGGFLANAAKASRKDARDAVVAARGAVAGWGGATAYNRGQVLYRIAELLEGRRAQFVAEIEEAEGVSAAVAAAQVDEAIDRWVWYAGWADKYAQVAGNAQPGRRAVLQHLGARADRRRRDRRAAGLARCSASSRRSPRRSSPATPSSWSPASGSRCRRSASPRCSRRATCPKGVVNVLTGSPAEIAPWLASHADVNAIDLVGAGDLDWISLEVDAADTLKRVLRARVGSRRRGAGARAHQRVHRDQDGLAHQEPEVAVSGRGGASDERGRLVADPFDYRVTKHGGVIVSRGGRVVMTVGGADAGRLIVALQRADDSQAQHLLARASGNYRRGNERA